MDPVDPRISFDDVLAYVDANIEPYDMQSLLVDNGMTEADAAALAWRLEAAAESLSPRSDP